MKRVEIQRIARLPPQILPLEKEAIEEGFRFLARLIAEWRSEANRFDAPGECLMAAYRDHRLIGIGGPNGTNTVVSVPGHTSLRRGSLSLN